MIENIKIMCVYVCIIILSMQITSATWGKVKIAFLEGLVLDSSN